MVRAFHTDPGAGLTWPDDFVAMTTAQLTAPADPAGRRVDGGAHIPTSAVAFTDAPAQNPAGWQPVARASLRNLIDWIRGRTPPDSNYITLDEEVGDLFGAPFRQAIRDADGNALGGVRLPHMTATTDGHQVGAPLGRYEGFDFSAQDFFTLLGGISRRLTRPG